MELTSAASGTPESKGEAGHTPALGLSAPLLISTPFLLMTYLLLICDRLCVSPGTVTPALSAHVHAGPGAWVVGGVSH